MMTIQAKPYFEVVERLAEFYNIVPDYDLGAAYLILEVVYSRHTSQIKNDVVLEAERLRNVQMQQLQAQT